MVDYWVSRERHYCKYCNAWMQSDKLVRLLSLWSGGVGWG
jgi:hypothetical protein